MLTADRSDHRAYAGGRALPARSVDARWLLAGIVLLAVAVRFVGIGSRLHIDDAYSWLVASSPSPHAFLRQLAASENTPPLFYLLLQPLPFDHPVWLRIPAAVPGVLMCVVLFYALRRAVGDRAALLASLAVAVAPFLITDSDLGRGFMLADLALLVVLWAMFRLVDGASPRWAAVFLVAGAIALYTEYASAIFLVAVTATAVLMDTRNRGRLALLGGATLLTLAPWIPQIVRGQDQVNVTKLDPLNAAPSITGLRDASVTLALGEHGGTSNAVGRWLEFGVMLGLAVGSVVVLRRGWNGKHDSARRLILLLGGTFALTLAGHAIVGAVGVDVFSQRYMTILVPVGAGLGAVALVSVERRSLPILAAVALLGLGIAALARRYQGQWEPDVTPIRLAALQAHSRTVLTNTPTVLYYLRSLEPQFDRPNNLGPGRVQSCARPCLIVDDSRVHGGRPRRALGTQTAIGPYVLTLER